MRSVDPLEVLSMQRSRTQFPWGSICALDVATLVLKASSTLTHRVHGIVLAMIMPCCRVFYAFLCATWLLLVLLSLKKCHIWSVQYVTPMYIVTLFFLLRQVVFPFSGDDQEVLPT